MNLLLFRDRQGEAYPIVEFVSPAGQESAGRPDPPGGLKQRIRQAYQALREKFEYQERVCAHFRHADRITAYYAPSLGEAGARQLLEEFLKRRERKHRKWFWTDTVLALLGSLLTPIPGPNIFFFYPAARAVAHYLARQGVRKICTPDVLSFCEESRIDRIQQNLNDLDAVQAEIDQLELRFNIDQLKARLAEL